MKSNFIKAGLILLALVMVLSACKAGGSSSGNYVQLEDLTNEKPQAILKTSMGDITIVLFQDKAPKAVENFITHAKDGYYDGITFHRVIENFMIQGGDPSGDGSGGQSIWGKNFEDEFSDELKNFRGTLSMANSGANTNGSQFFIVSAPPIGTKEELEEGAKENNMEYDEFIAAFYKQNYGLDDPKLALKYAEIGGTPHLDNVHTVFGQVIDGMDIVDNISKVEKDGADNPLEPVVINSIEIIE